MKSRPALFLAIAVALVAGGAALNRTVAPVWSDYRARQPALRVEAAAAAGQGVTLALLGGFRALVADATWLRMYVLWEQRDAPAVATLIRLVAALDPRPVYFWLNGARILAHDLPAWRLDAFGGDDRAPTVLRDRVEREQALLAIRHLEAARQQHPQSVDLWVEQAGIEWHRLREPAAAAESYRRAAELPRAPYYVARLRAEVLRRSGRKPEALAWLKQIHPTLPRGDEAAAADLVLARIRDLERELGVPAAGAYRTGR